MSRWRRPAAMHCPLLSWICRMELVRSEVQKAKIISLQDRRVPEGPLPGWTGSALRRSRSFADFAASDTLGSIRSLPSLGPDFALRFP